MAEHWNKRNKKQNNEWIYLKTITVISWNCKSCSYGKNGAGILATCNGCSLPRQVSHSVATWKQNRDIFMQLYWQNYHCSLWWEHCWSVLPATYDFHQGFWTKWLRTRPVNNRFVHISFHRVVLFTFKVFLSIGKQMQREPQFCYDYEPPAVGVHQWRAWRISAKRQEGCRISIGAVE